LILRYFLGAVEAWYNKETNMSDLPKIGIDIGTVSTKIVELVPSGKDKWRLTGAASIATPQGGVMGGPGNLAAISQNIVKILKEMGSKSKRVVAALPEEQVSSHVVEMPMMNDEEVRQALQWQVEQYIPIPADKAVWSHQVIKKDQATGGMEVLLVAAAKNLVNSYIQVLEQAGLEVVALETELMATSRAEVGGLSPLALIVDVGSKGTDMGIVSHGELVFSRTIPTAGESLTRAVESSLGLDSSTAEQYKNSYGFKTDKLDGKLVAAMKPVITIIGNEIRKTADFYASKHQGEVVKMVVLSGGVANIPELVSTLSGLVGMEMVVGNPFSKVEMDASLSKVLSGSSVFYGVAVGLAMRPM
jgi:type IV pilus assembly protein PilM